MRAIRPKLRAHAREHIVTIDTDSAPRIMFYGENLLIEDLPGRHPRDLPEAADDRRSRTRAPRSATRSTTPRTASRCTRCSRRA